MNYRKILLLITLLSLTLATVTGCADKPLELKGHTNGGIYAYFALDGKRIVTSNSRTIRLWDAESGREIQKIEGEFHGIPTSKMFLTGEKLGGGTPFRIRRWDTETGKEMLPALEMPDGWGGMYSPDKTKIAMQSFDDNHKRYAFIWDVESGRKLQELSEHDYAFSPDSKKIAVKGYDGTRVITRIFDTESGKELQRVDGELQWYLKAYRTGACFSPDGRTIATGQDDNTRLWDVHSGRELQRFEGMPRRFFPDGGKFVTYPARGDTTSRIWDVDSGRELQKFEGALGEFSPDDKIFVTFIVETVEVEETEPSETNQHSRVFQRTGYTLLRIWDAVSCRELHEIRAKAYNDSFYFSSDGSKLITYDYNIIQIWDVKSGKELHSFEGDTRWPTRERITKVAATIADEGIDLGQSILNHLGTTCIWDINSGKKLRQFKGVFCGFSPDEKRVATASEDGTVRIWTLK